MLYVVDTKILLRSVEPNHPMHQETLAALALLRSGGHSLCVFPQQIIEFWHVATRPADKNGLGFTHRQAQSEVEKIEKLLRLILDDPAIYDAWKQLVIAHSINGKQVYDARIAAAMTVHGVTHLLTYNTDDFKRFTSIQAISPPALMPPSQPAQPQP
jgi:predicted nucleic acid-binding protein